MGRGAEVSCLTKYLHPSEHIRNKHPNLQSGHRTEGCIVLRQETKKVNRREQLCIIVRHDDYKADDGGDIELYSVKQWFRITKEGPADCFFEAGGAVDEEQEPAGERMPQIVQQILQTGRGVREDDLQQLRGSTAGVDDDNEPAPENVPDSNSAATNTVFDSWGHGGICPRRMSGAVNQNPTLKGLTQDVKPTFEKLFRLLFPFEFLKDVILKQTNQKMMDEQETVELTIGELLRYIGLWFYMSSMTFDSRRDFWSSENSTMFEGCPVRLNEWMSRRRFEAITRSLQLTSCAAPPYQDKFWEVRAVLQAWNENMKDMFTPGWISCLDESMSKWLNEYTCPGFMCVPRKPWPLGNEYHTIACGLSGVLYSLELVEGKDEPRERPRKEFEGLGKTVGLLLRLTQSLWGTGKAIVLDSGFCVLQGIVELRKKGVFAAALIKKRRYWPKYIDGDGIRNHFQDKPVGSVDVLCGELDTVKVFVHSMKEPDYVMMLMSTYGTTNEMGTEQRRILADNSRATFHYPEIVYNHFQYRDAVDSHNSSRMYPLALEETWKTTRWPLRVFQFLLAVTEVNCRLGFESLCGGERMSQQQFRRQFAKELIFNTDLSTAPMSIRASKRKTVDRSAHELIPLSPFRNFKNGRVVRGKTRSVQRKCFCSARRVNTYCKCSPGVFLCGACFSEHVAHCVTGGQVVD
jgi:hypothetical protein